MYKTSKLFKLIIYQLDFNKKINIQKYSDEAHSTLNRSVNKLYFKYLYRIQYS